MIKYTYAYVDSKIGGYFSRKLAVILVENWRLFYLDNLGELFYWTT